MAAESRFFSSMVFQDERARFAEHLIRKDKFAIFLYFYKVTKIFRVIGGCAEVAPGGVDELRAMRKFSVPVDDVKLLSRRYKLTQRLAYHLSKMGIPEDEHPAFIVKILDYVAVAVDPEMPIVGIVQDATHRCMESESDNGDVVERVMRESLETYMLKLIPATKSSIRCLEKVRLDSLDEATVRQAPSCVICLEGLDHHHFDIDTNTAAEDGDVNDQDQGVDHHHHHHHHRQQMAITRLPCLHFFHGGCIVQWLEISHLCPVCRFPMPTVEEGEPAEPKQRRLS